jgi:hypothetical protein
VYGGHDIREGSMNSLWYIDMEELKDLEKPEDLQEKKCMWKPVETTGKDIPGPLSHHTSAVYGDKMFLFGGSSSNGEENKHMYALDLKFQKWEIINSVLYLYSNN